MSLLEFPPGAESLMIDPAHWSLLLDIDGTLLDIAENPDAVLVPSELHAILARLKLCFGGAVALISGRPLSKIDQIFPGLDLTIIGCHGAEFRIPPTGIAHTDAVSLHARPLSLQLRADLARLGDAHRGLIVEDKIYSVALHYRAAPSEGPALLTKAASLCAAETGESLDILQGKCVFEIKPAGIDKGRAVRALLGLKPFLGRRPVFIGDDVTDEAAFAVLGEFSGTGISVGRPMPGAAYMFAGPRDVRAWLLLLASRAECRG